MDEKKTSDYVYFASDDINYLTIIFRLYNQIFENFIFFQMEELQHFWIHYQGLI